jgi:hypothetical protein
MKRLLILLFVLVNLSALGQTLTGERVVARQGLYLKDWWVDSIGRDTNFLNKTRVLPSAETVRRFVEGRLSGFTPSGPSGIDSIRIDGTALKSYKGATATTVATVATYSFSGLRDGDELAYDSLAAAWKNKRPAAAETSVVVSESEPATTNFYFKASDTSLNIKSGATWYKFKASGTVTAPGGGTPPVTATSLTFGTRFTDWDLTETAAGSGVWKAVHSEDGFSYGYGVDVAEQSLPAATTGRVWMQYKNTDGYSIVFGLKEAASQLGYVSLKAAVSVHASGQVDPLADGTVIGSATTLPNDAYIGLYRNGTTGTVKVQYSVDLTTWTDVHTFAYTSTAQLYIGVDMGSTPRLYYPQGEGVE